MKFNIEETKLLMQILKYNLYKANLVEANKKITYQTLIQKLENGEYIKGRLLNFLNTEISSSNFKFENSMEGILKKIKFKATPR